MAGLGFHKIAGHEDIIRQMKKAVISGRVSHTYLITGEEGIGKKAVAEAFAASIVCEDPEPEKRPCFKCSACQRAVALSHPDIIYVTHEKPRTISVEDVRSQVVATVDIRPYEAERKIYIMAEAEKMNASAQNALLKTLEEPPEYVTIILLTSNPDALLPTIISRCVRFSLLPVPDRIVEDYIREKLELPDYEAKVIAAFAQGNIGKADKAAKDEAFSEMKDQLLSLARGIGSMNAASVREAAKRICENREETENALDILLLYFRDVLYYKAAADVDGLVFSNEISAVRNQSNTASYEGLTEIVDAIERCRVRLRANVNPELALELLLFTIKENV